MHFYLLREQNLTVAHLSLRLNSDDEHDFQIVHESTQKKIQIFLHYGDFSLFIYKLIKYLPFEKYNTYNTWVDCQNSLVSNILRIATILT